MRNAIFYVISWSTFRCHTRCREWKKWTPPTRNAIFHVILKCSFWSRKIKKTLFFTGKSIKKLQNLPIHPKGRKIKFLQRALFRGVTHVIMYCFFFPRKVFCERGAQNPLARTLLFARDYTIPGPKYKIPGPKYKISGPKKGPKKRQTSLCHSLYSFPSRKLRFRVQNIRFRDQKRDQKRVKNRFAIPYKAFHQGN